MKVTSIVDHVDSFRRVTSQENGAETGQKPAVETGVRENREDIASVVDKLNRETAVMKERITFSYHEKTHTIVMRVHDSQTGDVIREIPGKDSLKLLEHIREYLGFFVDESR